MAKKEYDWEGGATLEEHSKRKLKILREYFHKYLITRCQFPQQERFRLAVVDGFCGGGRYKCGTPGSPIVFLEVLQAAIIELNLNRSQQGLRAIEIECLLVLNDESAEAVGLVRAECAPHQVHIAQEHPKLHVRVEIFNQHFESVYPQIKALISEGGFRNVLFNLDQCGYSKVANDTLIDVMRSNPSAEIFYTFAIESLTTYLSKTNPQLLADQLRPFGVDSSRLDNSDGLFSNNEWLGGAERLVSESFKGISRYGSPFSINNPDGWRYWLLHFANSYKARQVYNDVLHDNASSQAHFGRSGLEMLSYDPSHEGALYLFDVSGRERAKSALLSDIPKLIRDLGDTSRVVDFYETIYNATPAHADDIHSALIENPDIEVITPLGGERRKAGTIDIGDTIKLKTQTSFFPIFHKSSEPSK